MGMGTCVGTGTGMGMDMGVDRRMDTCVGVGMGVSWAYLVHTYSPTYTSAPPHFDPNPNTFLAPPSRKPRWQLMGTSCQRDLTLSTLVLSSA